MWMWFLSVWKYLLPDLDGLQETETVESKAADGGEEWGAPVPIYSLQTAY